MDSGIASKVERLLDRLVEVEEELGKPDAFENQEAYRVLTREHSYLNEVSGVWQHLAQTTKELADSREMLELESDEAFIQEVEADVKRLEKQELELAARIEELLVPPDPDDHRNTILEVRAGTGGDEAALFVGDCVRMYKLFADSQGWSYECLSSTPSEVGGYKEYIMRLSGQNVHRLLQYEAGTHRVQRVPDTETQGRVHTSAVTMAVLLEPDEESDIHLDEKDLRIDTYRASGAGGQHVNTTDSAVRITHIPTGTVAYCQDERSQHKNRDKAMVLLKARIQEEERRKQQDEIASKRAGMVGSGDRSERIRTYNFPQNRVTDHRINLTLYSLDIVMSGVLEGVIQPLVRHFYEVKLQA